MPHAELVVDRVAPGAVPAVIEVVTVALGGETADAVITIEPVPAGETDGGTGPLLRIAARSAHSGEALELPQELHEKVERAKGRGEAC